MPVEPSSKRLNKFSSQLSLILRPAFKSVVSFALVLCAGCVALAWVTDGFTVLTAESARQNAVAKQPMDLSVLNVRDQAGQPSVWPQALVEDGRISIVTFIYTRCKSICSVLNAQYRQMQEELKRSGLQNRVRLLTVTFDPARDTLTVLAEHARALNIDEQVWHIVRPELDGELAVTLKRFGIVTVLDENGEYQHNAAWHVVDQRGKLVGIFPVDQPERALQHALVLSSSLTP